MATEYIGSRYVPKFTDNPESQWTNTVTYEPLTIVLYQGNSYTSRQFVPIGIDINNTNYWAETGNYNAQVEIYRREVRSILPYDSTPTEGSAKGVTSDGVYNAINDVSNNLNAAITRIAELEAKLANVGVLSESNTYGAIKESGFIHD